MTSRTTAAAATSSAAAASIGAVDESSHDGSSSAFPPPPSPSAGEALKQRHTTDDTASDASAGGNYEVIEYDLNDSDHRQHYTNYIMFGDTQLHIEDNSPAAAALRANANVEVSRVGKAARAVHMQTVRKIVKRATMTSKSGVVRGKPPRLPPTIQETTGGASCTTSTAMGMDHSSYSAGAVGGGGALLDRIDEQTDGVASADENEHYQDSVVVTEAMPQDAHIPDGVVKGTAEAGNKGECKDSTVLNVCFGFRWC